MLDFLSSRLLLSLLYLATLFAGGALLLGQLRHVEGELFVGEGMTESVLVRESAGRRGLGSLHGMPAEAIPFDTPRVAVRRLDRNGAYDMVKLPFHVRLDAVTVLERYPPRDVVQLGDEHALSPGDHTTTNAGEVRFVETRPWAGLLRNPGGQPGVRVAVRSTEDAAWAIGVLDGSDWIRCGDAIVEMKWCAGAAEARAALPTAYTPDALATWRVRDGNVEHYLAGVTPGTGVTLSDGRDVRLLAFDPDGEHDARGRPCIRIRVIGGGAPEDQWVPANDDADPRIRFRYPTAPGPVIFLRPFGYNEAWARVFTDGTVSGEALLAAGEPWRVGDVEVRLDEALSTAVLVRADDEAVREALVDVGGETMAVREGASVTLEDGVTLAYRRADVLPDVRYDLTVLSPGMEEIARFSLAPGEHRRHGNWRFAPATSPSNVLHSAVIHGQRTLNRPAAWVGLACFATGTVGLTVVRLRRPKRKRPRRLMPPEA